jgi:translocation and assembly module TamA
VSLLRWFFVIGLCIPISSHAACPTQEDGMCAPLLKVVVEGVSGALYDTVLNNLSLARQQAHPRLNAVRIKMLHERAEAEIKRALEPFAYYAPHIERRLERLACHNDVDKAPPACAGHYWLAHYVISLGAPVRVTRVEIELIGAASEDSAFQALRQAFPLKPGDQLRHADYEQAKKEFLRLAHTRGYFEAYFHTHEIRVDKHKLSAEIVLSLHSGARYRFGDLRFEQHPTIFTPEFLQRFVDFERDSAYDADVLMDLHNSLVDSQYFAEALIEPLHEQATEAQMPILVRLTARKAQQYSAGIGYGTDTGVRGSLGWERRYLNARGHRFSTDLQASGGTDLSNGSLRWSSRYFIPVGHPNRQYLSFNAGYADEHHKQWQAQTALVSATYHRPRQVYTVPVQEIISLEYRHERYALAAQNKSSVALLMPIIEWSYVKAHPDRMYPHQGKKMHLSLRGALEEMGSDVSFMQARSTIQWIHSIGTQQRFLLRAEAGVSVVSALNELPASQRFFAGGDRSVRGYAYQSLGSRDSSGKLIGGEYVLAGSLEYEYRFLPQWSGAVFYDVGNAFTDINESLKHGVGIGARWLSPIGPVRIDLAFALASEARGVRLHIIIGPDL